MLIPSIDLQRGRVVQLVQGERLGWASDDLDVWVRRFGRFPLVQVIDLDAATGEGDNAEIVRRLCRQLPCQIGGGVRSPEAAAALIGAGARRVIVGSALFENDRVNVTAVGEFASAVGAGRLVAAVDGRSGHVAVSGWRRILKLPVARAMAELEPHVDAFLATLIDGEGQMRGLDTVAARRLRDATSRRVIVAGGITTREEVDWLGALGMDAVVGMAIYTGVFPLMEPDAT